MTAFAYMDPSASVMIENVEDKAIPTRVLIVQADGERLGVELSDSMLRNLAYHCALYYRQRTGKTDILPEGMTLSEKTPPPTLPRVRVRPTAEPVPQPPPVRVRVRRPV